MRKVILLFLLFLSVDTVRTQGQNITFSHLTTDDGLSQFSVNSMYIDEQGIIWIGTREGLNRYNGNDIKSFKLKKNDPNSLFSNTVLRITGNRNGKVYLLCTDGVAEFDLATQRFKTLLQGNVDAIYFNEKLYIGKREEVFVYNESTGNFDLFYHLAGKNITLSCLHLDKNKNLWMGTTSNGIYCLSEDKSLSRPVTKGNITSIYEDSSNELWIGSWEEGLYRVKTDGNIENLRHNPMNTNSLSNNNINNIMQDSNGNLWFSTSGSGLDRYRKESDDFENFDMQKDGLSSDCIYEVFESSIQKGHLLLITNQGFSEFDYPNQKFYNYGTENGFPLTAVNENALFVTHDGEVFLGGIQGMISFWEKKLHFSPKSYNILLSRLLVNGKEVTPGDETGILEQSICHTPEIKLRANQSMFSIEYATSNFIPANRDEILYRLEGFSDEWNHTYRKQTLITYTNLNPGKYTLVIKSQRDGIKEAKLLIIVLPSWYETWWAYLIYTIVTISLLWYLIQNYNSRIKLRESLKYEKKHIEDLEALNQSKLRFFTNISHEFRTPLTLIVGQVETLLQVQTFTPNIYNKVLGIYKNSLQLRELITELLDFRKQEQGHMKIKVSRHNLVNFLYENYLLFLEYASSKQINFKFNKQKDDIEVWYDQKQMQKVINNLLSNALKHTKAEDTISINVSQEEDYAIIEIKDTGSGIAAAEIDKIFDRFYQTEHLNSLNTGAGTGIGLALTKGIIELHQGTIRVESEPGKGSSFIITLKLDKKHFTEEQIAQESTESTIRQTETIVPSVEIIPDSEWKEEENKRIEGAKMLIVEDNESIKQMLAGIFETFYQVSTASDGEEALEMIQKEMPSIILSDVVMPRMSGTELCKRIKTDFNTCHIPVVLLTARTAIEHNIEGLKIGADDYITKPFNTNLLISRCNNLVNSRRLLQEKFSKQPQTFAQMLATNPMDKEMLDRAMDIIERHLDDTDFNVNIFAREMGMARTNLFTKLKAVTGQTPNDFILNIRLKKGAVMLRNNPELNITEISDRIGFSSSRYFSKCFKEIYHVSPLAYRKGEEKEEGDGEETDNLYNGDNN